MSCASPYCFLSLCGIYLASTRGRRCLFCLFTMYIPWIGVTGALDVPAQHIRISRFPLLLLGFGPHVSDISMSADEDFHFQGGGLPQLAGLYRMYFIVLCVCIKVTKGEGMVCVHWTGTDSTVMSTLDR